MNPGAPGTIGFAMLKGAAIVFSLMVVSYPFYRVVSLWLDKAIETHEAVLYLGTLLMLLLGIIAAWGTPLGWLLLFFLLAACLGLPIMNRVADKIALRRMEDQDIREFTATVAQQPQNTYPRERLARLFLARKQYDLALGQVQAALEIDPRDRNFERLRDRIVTEQRRLVENLKVCPKCMTENHAEVAACLKCGFLFVDPWDLARTLYTRPALQAAKWGGLGMLALSLALLALHASLVAVTIVMFLAVTSIFWFSYVHLIRLQ